MKVHIGPALAFRDLTPGLMRDEAENWLIDSALDACRGNRRRTAELIGMGLRTLGMKLEARRNAPAVKRCGP